MDGGTGVCVGADVGEGVEVSGGRVGEGVQEGGSVGLGTRGCAGGAFPSLRSRTSISGAGVGVNPMDGVVVLERVGLGIGEDKAGEAQQVRVKIGRSRASVIRNREAVPNGCLGPGRASPRALSMRPLYQVRKACPVSERNEKAPALAWGQGLLLPSFSRLDSLRSPQAFAALKDKCGAGRAGACTERSWQLGHVSDDQHRHIACAEIVVA